MLRPQRRGLQEELLQNLSEDGGEMYAQRSGEKVNGWRVTLLSHGVSKKLFS